MKTKTQQAKELAQAGDWKAALKCIKDFRAGYSRDEREVLSRGYECMVRPDFFKQLGIDCQQSIDWAIYIAKTKLGV